MPATAGIGICIPISHDPLIPQAESTLSRMTWRSERSPKGRNFGYLVDRFQFMLDHVLHTPCAFFNQLKKACQELFVRISI